MLVIEAEGGYFPNGLILTSVFWSVAFGFFALGKSDDDTTCWASTSEDLSDTIPVVEDGESWTGQVDVAERFHFFFTVAMYLSVG